MVTLTKGVADASFIVSEASGQGLRSRDTQVFDSTADWAGALIPAGQVYAVVGGDAVAFDGDDTLGAEDAAGILYEEVAAGETVNRTVIVRDAEVQRSQLTYDGTDAQVDAALAALGIIVREE